MTTYNIVRKTNDWNKFGDAVNVRRETIQTTTDPIVAGKALATRCPWKSRNYVTIEVVDGINGIVEHSELYAVVVGPKLFAAQLADDNFSINLDDFFNSL